MENESENVNNLKKKFNKLKVAENNYINGGFPPFVKCNENDEILNKNKNREFKSVISKNTISLKDLLKKK